VELSFDFEPGLSWVRQLIGKFRIEHFLILYFAAHLLQIAFPSDGGMIFDEAHYVPASLLTLNGQPTNLEHPPLGKIIGAVGIAIFGNNWFGWRFPQVVIQIVGLYLFYLVAKRLLGEPWALGATMLLGLDTLFFIHGGALLLDNPAFTLSFLTIELWFRQRYWWSAVSLGIAFFEREFAIFIFITLIAHHLAVNKGRIKRASRVLLPYTLIALVVLGGLLWIYDIQFRPPQSITVVNTVNAIVVMNQAGQPISTTLITSQRTSLGDIMWNPVQNIIYEWNYHGPHGIVINEPYRSYQYAWNWILPVHISPTGEVTWDTLDAATYYALGVSVSVGNQTLDYTPIWYRAIGNPFLWYGIWPALVALLLALKRRDQVPIVIFILTGILANYLPSVGLSLVTRRLGFNYYMLYVLPFLALGLVFAWKHLPRNWGGKVLAINVLAALVFFMLYFPVRPAP
jgi:4-amino-4-deoxy-L-arabinose transferase-like glycosyltransferase